LEASALGSLIAACPHGREEKRRVNIASTHIYQFLQILAHVISRDSKIGCRYNFPKYVVFTYFIML